ncbi:hypothetical protein Q31a_55850 [Aureliella helgolandensis]|uniref:Uncharacterized protein n=1 Tax=Aureliella helgolandensis TaxID=2527968 RepID=A0A518GF56_9BACT|nr:hypothetical protein Q31a_55850 [Aureliella helgolandensis]
MHGGSGRNNAWKCWVGSTAATSGGAPAVQEATILLQKIGRGSRTHLPPPQLLVGGPLAGMACRNSNLLREQGKVLAATGQLLKLPTP